MFANVSVLELVLIGIGSSGLLVWVGMMLFKGSRDTAREYSAVIICGPALVAGLVAGLVDFLSPENLQAIKNMSPRDYLLGAAGVVVVISLFLNFKFKHDTRKSIIEIEQEIAKTKDS